MRYLLNQVRHKWLVIAMSITLLVVIQSGTLFGQIKPNRVRYEAKSVTTYLIDTTGKPSNYKLKKGYWLIIWDFDKKKLLIYSKGKSEIDLDIISDLEEYGNDENRKMYFTCLDNDLRRSVVTTYFVNGRADIMSIKYSNQNSSYVISGVK